MSIEDVRETLRSDAGVVIVEAPAGCGKTHEAADAAVDLAATIGAGQEVLLLAHTNAAVQEFQRRSRSAGAAVRALTLDAFALEVLSAYARSLDLPSPLRPGTSGGVAFRELAAKMVELLRRAPSVARWIAVHYPVVVLDEHQDARSEQHELVMQLRGAGSRLRIFGDPMQAIYEFGDAESVDWYNVVAGADACVTLNDPWRWRDNPELGSWVLEARDVLRRGGTLPLDTAPESVTVKELWDMDDAPPFYSTNVGGQVIWCIRQHLNDCTGSVVILVRNKPHELGIRRAMPDELVLHEGAELDLARAAVSEALGAQNPRDLALAAVSLLDKVSTGLQEKLQQDIGKSLLADSINAGRRQKVLPILRCLEPIYGDATVAGWARAVDCLRRSLPDFVRLHMPGTMWAVGQLAHLDEGDAEEMLDEVLRSRKLSMGLPERSVMTIHKSKGHQFDHVVVALCGATPFPDSDEGRKLLYVALSRARRTVHILPPEDSASPLLPGD